LPISLAHYKLCSGKFIDDFTEVIKSSELPNGSCIKIWWFIVTYGNALRVDGGSGLINDLQSKLSSFISVVMVIASLKGLARYLEIIRVNIESAGRGSSLGNKMLCVIRA